MFNILNSFFNKRSVDPSPLFDVLTKVVKKPLTEIANRTFLDLGKIDINISLSSCSLMAEKDISTAVTIYHPASIGPLKDKIKTLWSKVIGRPLMIFGTSSTVKTTESTALSFYPGTEPQLSSFGAAWNRLLKTSDPVAVLEPKSSVSSPTLAVAAANNPAQRPTIFSWLPKFQFIGKKIEEKTFPTSFYNGQKASKQAFCEAWTQTLKKPFVQKNYTTSGFYAMPEATQEGFKKMWNEVGNSTKTLTQPEASYAKYVLYGLFALTACYFINKKLHSKEIDQKSREGNDFESFKKSIEEITANPITLAPAPSVSKLSTKINEVAAKTKSTVFKKILAIFQSLISALKSIFNLEDIFPSKGSKIFLP